MKVFEKIKAMQEFSRSLRMAGKKIAIVPTMGFLHEGHLSLIDTARKNGADAVVVTIFVNPIQFGPNEDFDKYPRDFERDKALLEEKNVDAIFAPTPSEMYPRPITCKVIESELSRGLCGKSRPTHFAGVTTVVTKLFNAVLPDMAVFGQKDAQQAQVLCRMVEDLNFPIEMIISPIVREADGLARSSRNKYLSPEERANALVLSRSLLEGKKMLEEKGEKPGAVISFMKENIEKSSGRVDYVSIVDAKTLEEVSPDEEKSGRELLIALAVYFGSTRLIDNILVSF